MKRPAPPRLISIARIQPGEDWRLENETHAHHELIVVAHGRLHARIDDAAVIAGPGDLLFYRQGRLHTEWNDPNTPFITYGYAFSHPGLPNDIPLITPDRDGRIRTLSDWLAAEFAWPWEQPGSLAQSLFQSVLLEWQRLYNENEEDIVTRSRQYMRHHLAEALPLKKLAKSNGMSRFHYLRKYKALSGHTPFQDLTRTRLEHARHLLLTTQLPLKALAPLCGLANQQLLCRLFRRHFGLTPGDVRRASRM